MKHLKTYNESLRDKMTAKSETEIEEAKNKLLVNLKEKSQDSSSSSEELLHYLTNIYDDRKQLMNDLMYEGLDATDVLITITDDLDYNASSDSELKYKLKVMGWMYNLIEKNIDKYESD